MKARTIATVAAAGLAALVGCKDKHHSVDDNYFSGKVDVAAPACHDTPQVLFNMDGLQITCGDYRLGKSNYNNDHSCTLSKRTEGGTTFMHSIACNEMLDDATWESSNPEQKWTDAYKQGLANIGEPEIAQMWRQWRENWKLVNDGNRGTQELQISATYCGNHPRVTMEPDEFEIACGSVAFTHRFSHEYEYSDRLTLNTSGTEVEYSDPDGNGEISYMSIKYKAVTPELAADYHFGLATIGYEDIEHKYQEWLKQQ